VSVAGHRLFKVEGAGNDFVLGLGCWADRLATEADTVVSLCRRRIGVGADGALALFPDGPDRIRLVYRNADGSTGLFCGNGTRCAAAAAVRFLGMPHDLVISTGWRDIPASVDGDTVRLELPAASVGDDPVRFETPQGVLLGRRVEVGVPHVLIDVDDPSAVGLERIGPALRWAPVLGPEGSNITVLGPERDGVADLRTWERGVEGETLCCGSAVVAAGVIRLNGGGTARLRARSGTILEVRRRDGGLELVGPARVVAEILPQT
jgi:diaminopimelate epimerase